VTEVELQHLLAYWQPRLRLADWAVTVQLVTTREIGDHTINGTCDPLLQQKVARIQILRPEDHPDNSFLPYDAERSLVHELLHCWAVPFEPENQQSLAYTSLEQMLNALARALVELKRQGGQP